MEPVYEQFTALGEAHFQHFERQQQRIYIRSATEQMRNEGNNYVQQTILTVTDLSVLLILVSIYSFLLLYNRQIIRTFFRTVFRKEHQEHVQYVLNQSKVTVTIFCMRIALTSTQQFAQVLRTGVVLTIVQFINNNILVPRIVGHELQIQLTDHYYRCTGWRCLV